MDKLVQLKRKVSQCCGVSVIRIVCNDDSRVLGSRSAEQRNGEPTRLTRYCQDGVYWYSLSSARARILRERATTLSSVTLTSTLIWFLLSVQRISKPPATRLRLSLSSSIMRPQCVGPARLRTSSSHCSRHGKQDFTALHDCPSPLLGAVVTTVEVCIVSSASVGRRFGNW